MANTPKFKDMDESMVTDMPMDDSEIADAEVTAHERLKAFEDKHLANAPRINGHIEKGIGSHFSRMTDEHKAHHDALTELVEAEKAHVEAGRAEAAAHARLEAAIKRVEATQPKD